MGTVFHDRQKQEVDASLRKVTTTTSWLPFLCHKTLSWIHGELHGFAPVTSHPNLNTGPSLFLEQKWLPTAQCSWLYLNCNHESTQQKLLGYLWLPQEGPGESGHTPERRRPLSYVTVWVERQTIDQGSPVHLASVDAASRSNESHMVHSVPKTNRRHTSSEMSYQHTQNFREKALACCRTLPLTLPVMQIFKISKQIPLVPVGIKSNPLLTSG